MGLGSDEMVDLEFIQDRTNERSAARPRRTGFLQRDESAKDRDKRQVASDKLADDTSVTGRIRRGERAATANAERRTQLTATRSQH